MQPRGRHAGPAVPTAESLVAARKAPLLAALLAALHAASYWSAGPVDDDYIVHRYAANLLAGAMRSAMPVSSVTSMRSVR